MRAIVIVLVLFLLYGTLTSLFPKETPPGAAAIALYDTGSGPVAAVRRDLANRLDVHEAEIEVVAVVPRRWTDTCLGIPQEGEGCARMEIEGFEIELRAAGGTHRYRTDRTGGAMRVN